MWTVIADCSQAQRPRSRARDRAITRTTRFHRERIASDESPLIGGASGRLAKCQAHQATTAASHTDPMANVCDANWINGKLLTGCSSLHKGHALTWRKSGTVLPAAHIGKSHPIENAAIRSRRTIPHPSKCRTNKLNSSRTTGSPCRLTVSRVCSNAWFDWHMEFVPLLAR